MNRKKIKLSVIVPIYNIEKYVEKCILSLEESTYDNLEVILVDDGSTDRSGNICDEYSQKYKNIEVVHQINKGLMKARRAGVTVATGDFITFVDGDDYVTPDLYERLVEILVNKEVDVLCFGFSEVEGEKILRTVTPCFDQGIYYREEIRKKIMPGLMGDKNFRQLMPPCAWGKIYRYNIFYDNMYLVPDMISIGEDVFFSLVTLRGAKTVWIDKSIVGYCYVQRKSSMSHKCDEVYWNRKNEYCKALEQFSVQYSEWDCWQNIKTEKLRAIESVIQTEIKECKDGSYILIKKIKKIVYEYEEIEKTISQFCWKDVKISFYRKLLLLLLKYRLYSVLIILKKVHMAVRG